MPLQRSGQTATVGTVRARTGIYEFPRRAGDYVAVDFRLILGGKT